MWQMLNKEDVIALALLVFSNIFYMYIPFMTHSFTGVNKSEI